MSEGFYLRLKKIDKNNNLLKRFDSACEINFQDRSEVIRQFMYEYIRKAEQSNPSLTVQDNNVADVLTAGNTIDNKERSKPAQSEKVSQTSATSEYLKKINYTPSWRK